MDMRQSLFDLSRENDSISILYTLMQILTPFLPFEVNFLPHGGLMWPCDSTMSWVQKLHNRE